ncbi:spore germination protein [Bacillus paramycoides]|uniref:spore germination protein n=1 Tax=Bacillus paramycoides TaxID=2026194 RepID=UPI002E1D3635|nr:spore germination protein [Bacillus paramycoides]MED1114265.1 spore germination protein [Bacillus paramycoides]
MNKRVELNEKIILEWFEGCNDVKVIKRELDEKEKTRSVLFMYCQNLIDNTKLKQATSSQVCKELLSNSIEEFNLSTLIPQLSVKKLDIVNSNETISQIIFEGNLLIIFEESKQGYIVDIAQIPTRSVEQTNTEMTIRGGRDGFVEELNTNIGLIRKRLKTSSLSYEEFIIGERTQTKVALLYLKDIASQDIINQVRLKLRQIKIDGVVSSAQIEELITNNQFSVFPLVEYTGRPDYAVNCLLYGRFILLVEGSPTVTIAPVTFPFFVNTSEDQDSFYIIGSFVRLVSLLGIAISIFLPGIWIALITYHPDQIPYTLLATLSLSREGIPFPAPLEGLIMMTLFEILRQAGLRVPAVFGQTLSVVGGLIIGQAAISAGIVSASMVIIIAISVVSTFALTNQSVTGIISILRYVVFLISSLLGIVGFIFCIFVIVIHVVNLRSFGVPFFTPYSPPVFKSMLAATFRIPFTYMNRRPKELHTQDNTRKRESTDEKK